MTLTTGRVAAQIVHTARGCMPTIPNRNRTGIPLVYPVEIRSGMDHAGGARIFPAAPMAPIQ